jgi:hypothetical protein
MRSREPADRFTFVAFYLVERYVPSMPAADIREALARISAPQDEVRHLWTVLVRAEDTCLSVFEASDVEAVVRATARAGFPCDRVVEVTPVVDSPSG